MARGAQDGVELNEHMVVIGVLIVTRETHGRGHGFSSLGKIAAFAE